MGLFATLGHLTGLSEPELPRADLWFTDLA
jgi:hypothetical protein